MKNTAIVNLDKIIHKMTYVVNESPKYRPIVGNSDEFDNLSEELYEESDENVKPPAAPAAPAPEMPVDPAMPPVAAPAMPPADPSMPVDPAMPVDPEMPVEPMMPEVPDVNSVQNEIIKNNISAMKAIHDQLISLNDYVTKIDAKVGGLNAEVEEVREPTNSEKLMSKSKVSYPYYFNLNDFWSDTWFDRKNKDSGIKKLDDGTYVANFDDLPESDSIKDSFDTLT